MYMYLCIVKCTCIFILLVCTGGVLSVVLRRCMIRLRTLSNSWNRMRRSFKRTFKTISLALKTVWIHLRQEMIIHYATTIFESLSLPPLSLPSLLSLVQMAVAGFSGNTDLSRAQEISNEVRRIVKNLKECQNLAQLYNQRERLFGQPVTQV